jgi:hypothetical protein
MDFYYMGEVSPKLDKVQQSTMLNDQGKQLPVVKIRFNMINPVTSTIYDYLHESVFRTIRTNKRLLNRNLIHLKDTIQIKEN